MSAHIEVPYRGPITGVDIVIVGESPGAFELYRKQPFVGDSGDIVERELRANGLDVGGIFYANACRCMLGKEDKTSKPTLKAALAACRPKLETTIKALKPKLIIVFGDVALMQIMKQSGITKHRGRLQWSEEFCCHVLSTFHPAACLRDPGKFTFWRPDIAYAARFAKAGFKADAAGASVEYEDVDSIRFLLDMKDITVALDTETYTLKVVNGVAQWVV
jgi:DNA polymerase